jgi:phytoene synthase
MTPVTPPPPGGARYHAWLFAPPAARDALAALLQIERELDDSSRPGLEHSVGHARLDWWQQEAALFAAGEPRHPATRALARGCDPLDRADLAPLVEIARWRHAQLAFEDRTELQQALSAWSASVFAPLCRIGLTQEQGTPDARAALTAFGQRAGDAVREIEWLAQAARRARLGLLPLPLDELEAAGCDHAALQQSPLPATVAAIMRARLERCCGALTVAAAAVPGPLRGAARAGLVWTAAAATLARRSADALPNEYAPARFAPLAATLAAWRAARACVRGQLPAPLRPRTPAA